MKAPGQDSKGPPERRAAHRRLRRFVIGTSVVLAAGLGGLAVALWPTTYTYHTDADTINESAATARIRDILWQPPIRLPDLVNSDSDEYEPRLSGDGMTLFFVRGKAGENADVYYCARGPEGWGVPEALTEINTEFDELGAEPSADGRSLYFYSDRPGGGGGYDLWVVHRGLDGRSGFGEAINLGPLVNSEFNDYGPALTQDGETLYFASNRPQATDRDQPNPDAWSGTIREDLFHRTYDLYAAPITEQGPGQAQAVDALNSSYNEGAPAVSPFGDFVYFASDRPGGEGAYDLHRSRRLSGAHEPVTNLGGAVNTAANELDPGLTMGGYALYFSSDRPVGRLDPEKPNAYHVYQTTSREVFTRAETRQASINWAAIWAAVGPNLLWALLALLLLLLMLSLFREMKSRKLSLLARCLLASLAAHLLLMLLFNVWGVTTSLVREFGRRSRIQVALVGQSRSDDVVAQIRGVFTNVEAPQPAEVTVERRSAPLEVESNPTLATLDVAPRALTTHDRVSVSRKAVDAAATPMPTVPTSPPKVAENVTRTALDLAVPVERVQVYETESSSAAMPERVANVAADRPEVHRNLARPTEAAARAKLAPRSDVGPGSRAPQRSLAKAARTRDASVTTRVSPPPMATTASLEELPALEVAIPQVPQSQSNHDELPAPATGVSALILEPTRRTRTTEIDSGENADALTSLEPAATVLDRVTSGLADAGHVRQVDARIGSVALAARYPGDAGQKALPPAELSLPSLELPLLPQDRTDGEASPDGPARVATADLEPIRPNSIAESITRDEASGLREIPPGATTLNSEAVSLAESPAARGVEVHFASSSPGAPDGDDATKPALPFSELALPMVEEPVSAPLEERATQPESVALAGVRGSVAELAGLREQESLPSFGVSPVGRLLPNAAPNRLTDLPGEVRDARAPPAPRLTAHRDHALMPDTPTLSLPLPTEVTLPDNAYAQRLRDRRLDVAKGMGGSEETEEAVERALRWLAAHQSEDGRWDGDGFDDGCGECGGETDVAVDVSLTGLSVLCFLAADHSPTKEGPYRDTVERAVLWLVRQQRRNGDLRGDETMYSHGIATIALAEAYGMSADSRLREPVQRAVWFIEQARNERTGIWRYDPGQPGDTSVLGWQIMALKSAKEAGVAVPMEPFLAARRWLDEVSSRRNPGLYAYQPGREATAPMTAEGLFIQQLLGRRRAEPRMQQSVDFLLRHRPDWEEEVNTYYWYYGTLALFHHQGEPWQRWNGPLTAQLLAHQRREGAPAGSWDPDGEWAEVGGRVYQTALCTLMLEVYYRYLPLFLRERPVDAIGTIQGYVTDGATRRPLAGAAVRLDLPDRPPVEVITMSDGAYELHPPEVPPFFALSASSEGYTPMSKNVAAVLVQGTTLGLDFELQPESEAVVAIEAVPDVHHLGDNAFSGKINSQFQKQSEGSEFLATFGLTAAQLPPYYTSAEVAMLVKGVQMTHRIRVNGRVIGERLDDAPNDGSFGVFSAPFDPELLEIGANTIEILASSRGDDVDDFEFVNLQIRLLR